MDDHFPSDEILEDQEPVIEAAGAEDEYEEIDSEEVDRVVAALEQLTEQTHSENIRHYLEEASSNIYFLVYTEEDAAAESDDEDVEMIDGDDEIMEDAA